MTLLAGRCAVVTGAARGIGAGIARAMADAGAAVVVTDIDAAGAGAFASELSSAGARAWAVELDVTDGDSCADAVRRVEDLSGGVDILVNNAGLLVRAPLGDPALEEIWPQTMAVNLTGPWRTTTAFLPMLRRSKGCVINVASIQAVAAIANSVAYNASKGGLAQLTRAMAQELGSDGIRVNAIAPGITDTPLTDAAAVLARYRNRVPLGRYGTPADIGGPAVFLASDLAAYVTGVMLPVDGGFLAT